MTVKPTRWERHRYWQGQQLRSRDLNDQLLQEDQLRWWHNRALHNACGVAQGLETKLLEDGVTIQIKPGVAYDLFGRELWIAVKRELSLPTESKTNSWTLILSHPDGITAPIYTSALPTSNAMLSWQPSQHVSLKAGIPLIRLQDGKQETHFNRPFTQQLTHPHIGHGMTLVGDTNWEPWEIEISNGKSLLLGLQVRVSTTEAGFMVTPCYFAGTSGSLSLPSKINSSYDPKRLRIMFMSHLEKFYEELKQVETTVFQFLTTSVGDLYAGTDTEFIFRLRLSHINEDMKETALKLARTHLSVWWIGVESGFRPEDADKEDY